MSQDVDRNQVFQTTRVRTALKNDVSWIQKSKQAKRQEDNDRTDQAVETNPVLVRQNSYVLSTAKKFESVDSPLSPPLQNTQFIPSEGDSANQANGVVIHPQKYAQPEGSTVKTTNDTKPQAPAEENIQNGEAQSEKSVGNTTEENKEEDDITAVDQSNVEPNAAEVSADIHVGDHVAETSAAAGIEESKDSAEVFAMLAFKGKLQEEPSTETEPANATNVEDVGDSTVKHAEGKCPPEPTAEEIVEAVAEVVVESSPDKSDVTNAMPGEEAALHNSVEPVPDLLAEPIFKLPIQPAAETATEGSCENSAPGQVAGENVDAVAEVHVESSAETPAVSDAAGEEAAPQDDVEKAPDLTASDAEAVQDKFTYNAIELTDALDVEPPADETAPDPLKGPKQSLTDETKLNQQSDDATSEMLQKPVDEPQSTPTLNESSNIVCSFCDKIIDGNVKLRFSEPLLNCHPECLKCGVCAKALGDLLIPMFLYNQVIQCDGCFEKALKA